MEAALNNDRSARAEIIKELVSYGCCNLCILRYLGNTTPYAYRQDESAIIKFFYDKDDHSISNPVNQEGDVDNGVKVNNGEAKQNKIDDISECCEPASKLSRKTPCTSCLGLLDESHGTSEVVLEQIAKLVKESDIQAKSYTINLSLPIAIAFRAYFVWNCLTEKFPNHYNNFSHMKPEGVCLKNAWKWICTGRLKDKIDPNSDWTTDGCLTVNVALKYEDEDAECLHLSRQFKKSDRGPKSKSDVTRTSVDSLLQDMNIFEFKRKFGDAPPAAKTNLIVDGISCIHVPIFIAGRYNKYSRNVSQTPWIIEGKRFHDGSVEELIADHVLTLTQAEKGKFSASGREDVDVRMLGDGRPFLMEIIQPKRTLFTQKDMSELRDKINKSTKLIRVRDLQLVDRKCTAKLKEGEELKAKNYCALCIIPDSQEISSEVFDKLNNLQVPIVLQQKTPIRVLHRRSLATRERSVYSVRAVPGKTKNVFKLYLKTQAGTYVKEFVHGDLGRTQPSVGQLLGTNVDIVSLDVESIDFPWPPTIAE